jgi:hypothetical protein
MFKPKLVKHNGMWTIRKFSFSICRYVYLSYHDALEAFTWQLEPVIHKSLYYTPGEAASMLSYYLTRSESVVMSLTTSVMGINQVKLIRVTCVLPPSPNEHEVVTTFFSVIQGKRVYLTKFDTDTILPAWYAIECKYSRFDSVESAIKQYKAISG